VEDRTNPDISPLYGDLNDLPPALLTIGTEDPVLEDTLLMAMRLAAAGGDVDLRVYPESGHGFLGFPIAMARAANEDIESWLAARFGTL
jgi:acetyl esterase/lipase